MNLSVLLSDYRTKKNNTIMKNQAMESFKDMELQVHAINLFEKYEIPEKHLNHFVNYYLLVKKAKGDSDEDIMTHYLKQLFVEMVQGTKTWD